jgi:hypothetical protein
MNSPLRFGAIIRLTKPDGMSPETYDQLRMGITTAVQDRIRGQGGSWRDMMSLTVPNLSECFLVATSPKNPDCKASIILQRESTAQNSVTGPVLSPKGREHLNKVSKQLATEANRHATLYSVLEATTDIDKFLTTCFEKKLPWWGFIGNFFSV